MLLRTIQCTVCKNRYTEKQQDEGFPGWGQLMGISLNGDSNPYLCPVHLARVANFLDAQITEHLHVVD